MHFDDLKRVIIGDWRGTSQLYLEPPPTLASTSSSQLAVQPVADGSFLELRYDWAFAGEKQTGLLLFGADEKSVATAAWVDSFHMTSKVMFCTGTASAGAIELRGTYEAPPGPDWGWRITLRSVTTDEFEIVMHNISPTGQEDLAVQTDYRRRLSAVPPEGVAPPAHDNSVARIF